MPVDNSKKQAKGTVQTRSTSVLAKNNRTENNLGPAWLNNPLFKREAPSQPPPAWFPKQQSQQQDNTEKDRNPEYQATGHLRNNGERVSNPNAQYDIYRNDYGTTIATPTGSAAPVLQGSGHTRYNGQRVSPGDPRQTTEVYNNGGANVPVNQGSFNIMPNRPASVDNSRASLYYTWPPQSFMNPYAGGGGGGYSPFGSSYGWGGGGGGYGGGYGGGGGYSPWLNTLLGLNSWNI